MKIKVTNVLKSLFFLSACGLSCNVLSNETLVYQVTQGSDDAEEKIADPESMGQVELGSSDLELGQERSSSESAQLVGVRFQGIQIPKGTKIVSAYLQFTTDEDKNNNPAIYTISGHASDSSPTFSEALNNISSRERTGANVIWADLADWEERGERSSKQRTPNLAAVVQEIINRDGWQSGNALSFLIQGDGRRVAESYEGSVWHLDGLNDYAVQLVISIPRETRYRINARHNDAEERVDTGKVSVKSSDLELGWETENADKAQIVGLRFEDVGVPQNAQILSASIQFAQDENKNNNPFAMTVWGEANANPQVYKKQRNNISERAKTISSVNWSGVPDWNNKHEAGDNQRTPDLTTIVQELVNAEEWQEGNSMAFILTGNGTRTAESFDGKSDLAPLLKVKFIGESKAASVGKVRLAWNADPASTMTVIWDQLQGSNSRLHLGLYDGENCPTDTAAYSRTVAPHKTNSTYGMNNTIVRLTGLQPETAYRFMISDSANQSECMWFRTAPNTPKAFSYITGGDTKSSGNALEVGRWSNRLVAKLRPLFVMFTGDFNSGNGTNGASWRQWLNDWSILTKSSDGQMYPLLAVHGNHEDGDFEALNKLFDAGNPDPQQSEPYVYGALSFGGNLMRVYSLNSQLYKNGMIEAHDQQNRWFKQDLIDSQNVNLRIAGYHKPMRPHTRAKSEGNYLVNDWAALFDNYDMHVVYESDTHNHVLTFPIRLAEEGETGDMNFIRDDANGTIHVGEGSWGATPRNNNDDKSWTLDSASMNQVKINYVYPAQGENPARIEIRSVKTAEYINGELINYTENVAENTESNRFVIPEGAQVRNIPFYGEYISYPFQPVVGDVPQAPVNMRAEATGYFSVHINWENVAEPSTVKHIQIERKIGETGEWTLLDGSLSADTTRYSQDNLRDNTTYYYHVRATNIFGFSEWSNEIAVTTPRDPRVKLELQEGVGDYSGNTVLAIASGSPDTNFTDPELSIDMNTSDYGDSGASIGLIKFSDIYTKLPANAVIESAQIRTYVTSSSNGPVSLHRMLKDWTTESASWNSFDNGIQADNSEAVVEADSTLSDIDSGMFVYFNVTKSLKAWQANPSSNFGWAILNASGDGWDFTTDQFDTTDMRPKLTVFYRIQGDVNGDGAIDRPDLISMRNYLRQTAEACPVCDLDNDGMITSVDLRRLVLLIRRQ